MRTLFIGGPLHGKAREVRGGDETYRSVTFDEDALFVGTDASPRDSEPLPLITYHKKEWRTLRGKSLFFMCFDPKNTTKRDLIDAYGSGGWQIPYDLR